MKKKLKVAVVFNEANPEFYAKPTDEAPVEMNFIPYFEVDDLTPIEEYELLAEKLAGEGFDVYVLNIMDDIQLLLDNLKENKPDVIFNFIELYKENARLEMNIVGIFEILGIPYTGAPPMALANCQNKLLAKKLLSAAAIQSPSSKIFTRQADSYDHNLNFPLIVKPAYEDASVGIENDSIVLNNKQLKERIDYVFFNLTQPALVEEFIDGRELNVAVIGDLRPRALPISEIDFSEMPRHLYNIVSYQAKWDPKHEAYHKTIPICPAELPPSIAKEAKSIALKAFQLMGARDYARIDIRLSKKNKLYVLEVNPNPDLTEGAGFMRSAEAAGYSYTKALKKIVELAHERGKRNNVKRKELLNEPD
jgi:D-alanine-D-alanine ligase